MLLYNLWKGMVHIRFYLYIHKIGCLTKIVCLILLKHFARINYVHLLVLYRNENKYAANSWKFFFPLHLKYLRPRCDLLLKSRQYERFWKHFFDCLYFADPCLTVVRGEFKQKCMHIFSLFFGNQNFNKNIYVLFDCTKLPKKFYITAPLLFDRSRWTPFKLNPELAKISSMYRNTPVDADIFFSFSTNKLSK